MRSEEVAKDVARQSNESRRLILAIREWRLRKTNFPRGVEEGVDEDGERGGERGEREGRECK